MDAEELFVKTLSDLEQRTAATDEYEVLMSAALLRKLLLDKEPLMDKVKRRFRLDVRFHINDVSPYEQLIYQENPMFWVIEDALDPESPFAHAPFYATRDQFLARRVMCFTGSSSQLLRAGPPARAASVLTTSGVLPSGGLPLASACHTSLARVCRISARVLPFHAGAADQAHAAFTPDTTWPLSGHPPGSSRRSFESPVSMSSVLISTLTTSRHAPRPSPPRQPGALWHVFLIPA